MMEMRARAYALRGAFADALLGFHAREEMEDAIMVEADATVRDERPARRMRTVQASIGSLDIGTHDAATTEQTSQGAADQTAVTPAADEAQGQTQPETNAPQESHPTEDDLRNAVADAVSRGNLAKAVIASIETALGYRISKASDVLAKDRSAAIDLARKFGVAP